MNTNLLQYKDLFAVKPTIEVSCKTQAVFPGEHGEHLQQDANYSFDAVVKAEWPHHFVDHHGYPAAQGAWESGRVALKTIDYQCFDDRRFHHIFILNVDCEDVAVAYVSGREGRDNVQVVWKTTDDVLKTFRFLMEFHTPNMDWHYTAEEQDSKGMGISLGFDFRIKRGQHK